MKENPEASAGSRTEDQRVVIAPKTLEELGRPSKGPKIRQFETPRGGRSIHDLPMPRQDIKDALRKRGVRSWEDQGF